MIRIQIVHNHIFMIRDRIHQMYNVHIWIQTLEFRIMKKVDKISWHTSFNLWPYSNCIPVLHSCKFRGINIWNPAFFNDYDVHTFSNYTLLITKLHINIRISGSVHFYWLKSDRVEKHVKGKSNTQCNCVYRLFIFWVSSYKLENTQGLY